MSYVSQLGFYIGIAFGSNARHWGERYGTILRIVAIQTDYASEVTSIWLEGSVLGQ